MPSLRFDPEAIAELNAFLEEFQRESERAAAVLARAYLDSLLESLLAASFIRTPEKDDRVFAPEGPLGTFSARIKLAFFMGLITEAERHDLDVIREIANRFAHKIHGWTFSHPEIADRCKNLECTEERFAADPSLGDKYPRDPRSLFNLGVGLLAYYLSRRIKNAVRLQPAKPPLWLPDKPGTSLDSTASDGSTRPEQGAPSN